LVSTLRLFGSRASPLPESDCAAELSRRLEGAVREAGALALDLFRKPVKSWIKGKNSPVSEIDIAVDDLLKDRLYRADPRYGWLSEETADDRGRLDARRVWIVDPIDGTRAYLAGMVDWSIAAALVEDGRPVLAAVFAPASEEMFLASRAGGATRNGIPIRAREGDVFEGARVAGPQRYVERLAKLHPGLIGVPKIHSLALRIARVAEGAIDVALAGGNGQDWDLAAADLLVHEAGGTLTTVAGEHLTYNRADPVHGALVAAAVRRHEMVSRVLREQQREFR
jgi:myo-inositol-1(or 4)-monophosphatase